MPTDPRYDYALCPPWPPGPVDHSLADADISLDTRLGMHRELDELRQTGKRAQELFLQNLVKGTTHLSLGMEAVATGFGAAMQAGDHSFATYRGHAHSLARGIDWARRWRSCSGGRMGSSVAKAGRCTSPMSPSR